MPDQIHKVYQMAINYIPIKLQEKFKKEINILRENEEQLMTQIKDQGDMISEMDKLLMNNKSSNKTKQLCTYGDHLYALREDGSIFYRNNRGDWVKIEQVPQN